MRLFAYGTLCRGLSRHSALRDCELLGPATCRGRLVDVGSYPGLLAGDGTVRGELYQLRGAETLRTLDAIEGYDPADEPGSLYLRRLIRVLRIDTEVEVDAFAYLYRGASEGLRAIPHGDYRQYLEENG